MRDLDLDGPATAAARSHDVAVRRVAPEDCIGDGICIGGDALIGIDEEAGTRGFASRFERANVGYMVELSDRGP